MENASEFFATIMLIAAILSAGSPFIKVSIRLYGMQSWALSFYILTVAIHSGVAHLYSSAIITAVFKGMLIPYLLTRTLEKVRIEKEGETSIGFPSMVMLSGGLALFAYMLSARMADAASILGSFVFPISLSTFFIGAMQMVVRRVLFSQIISFLMIENAIFLAANSVTHGMPMVIELGVLLDLLIGVIIASILVLRIKKGFEDIQTDKLEGGKQ